MAFSTGDILKVEKPDGSKAQVTKTELDSEYVNTLGDTMTGALVNEVSVDVGNVAANHVEITPTSIEAKNDNAASVLSINPNGSRTEIGSVIRQKSAFPTHQMDDTNGTGLTATCQFAMRDSSGEIQSSFIKDATGLFSIGSYRGPIRLNPNSIVAPNKPYTFNNGSADFGTNYVSNIGLLTLNQYTTGNVPAAATYPFGELWVAGDRAYSDGTNWRRVSDDTVIV